MALHHLPARRAALGGRVRRLVASLPRCRPTNAASCSAAMIQWLEVGMQARSVRSPATKQRARPHRCHRQVARGQVSVIVEHTDDDRCEDRRDDKQHHYADHERPPIFALPSCRGAAWHELGKRGYCAADTAEAPLRSWLMRSPTSTAWRVGELREYALDAFMRETKERSASRRTIRR